MSSRWHIFLTKRSGYHLIVIPKKCLEMVICQVRTKADLPPLFINKVLGILTTAYHKILGIMLCNINAIATNYKALRNVYILTELKRAEIPSVDLVTVYFALMRQFCFEVLLRYLGNKSACLSQWQDWGGPEFKSLAYSFPRNVL